MEMDERLIQDYKERKKKEDAEAEAKRVKMAEEREKRLAKEKEEAAGAEAAAAAEAAGAAAVEAAAAKEKEIEKEKETEAATAPIAATTPIKVKIKAKEKKKAEHEEDFKKDVNDTTKTTIRKDDNSSLSPTAATSRKKPPSAPPAQSQACSQLMSQPLPSLAALSLGQVSHAGSTGFSPTSSGSTVLAQTSGLTVLAQSSLSNSSGLAQTSAATATVMAQTSYSQSGLPQPQASSHPTAVKPPKPAFEGHQKTTINFSEFEAESDPFDSLELKTINDMQALASVLQTSTASSHQQSQQLQHHHHHHNRQQQHNHRQHQQPPQQHQAQRFTYPTQSPVYSGYGASPVPSYAPISSRYQHQRVGPQQQRSFLPYPVTQQNALGPARIMPTGSPLFTTSPFSPSVVAASTAAVGSFVGATSVTTASHGGQQLKPSKSFGDLVGEINAEVSAATSPMAIPTGNTSHGTTKNKLHSVTPPPRVSNLPTTATRGLEDWVPWPDLDSGSTRSKPSGSGEEEDPFQVLVTGEERRIARQVADMGFPKDRAARACQALGCTSDGGARAIHFCLLAGKTV